MAGLADPRARWDPRAWRLDPREFLPPSAGPVEDEREMNSVAEGFSFGGGVDVVAGASCCVDVGASDCIGVSCVATSLGVGSVDAGAGVGSGVDSLD